MAVGTARDAAGVVLEPPSVGRHRAFALGGLGLVTVAAVRILYEITVILGGSADLVGRIVLVVGVAAVTARLVHPRAALAIFGSLAAVSYLWYFAAATGDPLLLLTAPHEVAVQVVDDSLQIVTGRSVLTIAATDVWALSFAPAPIFLGWYLGFRRRYALAGAVAGATMAVFVLSGDLDPTWTLLGTLGVVATVGFGTLDRYGTAGADLEWLLLAIAAMTVVALAVPLVPGAGLLGPQSLLGGDEVADPDATTIQSSVVGAGDELTILGEIELAAEARYTIESSDTRYWRTGVYDRYTGDGWVRTGDTEPFDQAGEAPADRRLVTQTIRTEVETDRIPAAAEPIALEGIEDVAVTDHGAVTAASPIGAGTTFTVVSAVPNGSIDGDRRVEMPDEVRERYTQLPETVPPRVGEFTDDLLVGAEGPLEKAERIEAFLRSEKGYSLNVSRPSGDIADAFLFEREAGYCTYFATTMVTMLRTADVPARMAVGYATGQEVAPDRWVVRGLNSHAWVEVYHPEAGWVTFDPTPSADRTVARDTRLEQARESGHPGVDTDESAGLPYDHDPSPPDPSEPANDSATNDSSNGSADAPLPGGGLEPVRGFNESEVDLEAFRNASNASRADPGEDDGAAIPWEGLLLGIAVLLGTVTGVRRLAPLDRLSRQRYLRWQRPSGDPRADVERANDRLEWALAHRFRPRRPTETPRQYRRLLAIAHGDVDDEHLFGLVERARYAGDVDDALAREVIDRTDRLVAETVVLGGGVAPNVGPAVERLGDRIL